MPFSEGPHHAMTNAPPSTSSNPQGEGHNLSVFTNLTLAETYSWLPTGELRCLLTNLVAIMFCSEAVTGHSLLQTTTFLISGFCHSNPLSLQHA